MPQNTSESNSDLLSDADLVAAGGNVRIRRKRFSDMRDDYAWQRNEELARLNAVPVIQEPIEAFAVAFEHERAFGRAGRQSFALDDAAGRHIGTIMYYGAEGDRAEIGITIGDPSAQDAGIGTQAMVTFLRFLWQNHPFRVIQLHVLGWNHRALRCFEKVGFRESARVQRNQDTLIKMEVRREWWLLWDGEGRYDSLFKRTSG